MILFNIIFINFEHFFENIFLYNGIKQTNKIPKNSKKLFDELESLKQKVNDIKQVNRDEELLRMQRENQEIEEKLNQLKQQDNT